MDNMVYTIEQNGHLVGLYAHMVLAETEIVSFINMERKIMGLPMYAYGSYEEAIAWNNSNGQPCKIQIRELYL